VGDVNWGEGVWVWIGRGFVSWVDEWGWMAGVGGVRGREG